MGIHKVETVLQLKLSAWWMAKVGSPCHKAILSLIPCCICWELWLNRNKARYENKRQLISNLIFNIESSIRTVLRKHVLLKKRMQANDLVLNQFNVDKSNIERFGFMLVNWIKPAKGMVKLNSDGCAKGNPGVGGSGSILRDCNGKMLWAQAAFFGEVTNMIAETKALLQGVERYKQRGISSLVIEVDSLILAQILQKTVNCLWQIRYDIRRIDQLLMSCDYIVQHVHREFNCAKDWLANIGYRSGMFCFCFFGDNLPKRLKGIVRNLG